MAQFPLVPSSETADLADDIRQLFDDISRTVAPERRALSGECHPAIDVRETDEVVEVTVDVAGVPGEAIRVLFRAGVLVIAGEKAPSRGRTDQQFHLVEREFDTLHLLLGFATGGPDYEGRLPTAPVLLMPVASRRPAVTQGC